MIAALINLIIYLIVIGLLYWVIIYVLDNIPIPEPLNRIIRVVLIVVIALIAIMLLLSLLGGVDGFHVPKLVTQ